MYRSKRGEIDYDLDVEEFCRLNSDLQSNFLQLFYIIPYLSKVLGESPLAKVLGRTLFILAFKGSYFFDRGFKYL